MKFTFQNDTRIHFGEGQIARIPKEIPKNKKVLLLYGGGSIKRNGVYQQVIESLKDHTLGEFSSIEPNPKYDTLMKAVKKIKDEGFNYLLAVGGGSVIDGAKFIAAASLYEGNNPWDMVVNKEKITEALPLGCILTLPATGSETNTASVISKGTAKLGFHSLATRPLFAILDPSTTLSLPKVQIANGIIDSYIHIIEQYLTYPVNAKVQDRFAEGLLLTLIEEADNVLDDPNNLETRANIMWSSTWALNGFLASGVPNDWTSHKIGHELTAHYGLDHAKTLTIILPAVLKVKFIQKQEKLVQYGKRVFGITEGSKEEIAKKAIVATEEFFKKLQMPITMADAGLNEKNIPEILNSLAKNQPSNMGEHQDIDINVAKEILEAAL